MELDVGPCYQGHFHYIGPEVIRFRLDPLENIGTFYIAIMVKWPNRSRAVKLFTIEQQPILKFN
jgi:hypothetical protein